jgi:serine/threonine-protein kinase
VAAPAKNVCAICGEAPPEGAQACPRDGNTLFIESSAGPDPLLGKPLGDYEVLEVIGEGGMGVVYKGIQPIIKKKVAIKVLRIEFASDPAQVKRLVSEAEAVNSISHRNIIDIFGLGQLPDGRHYIIMEFLEGVPLDQHLRDHAPLPPLEAVELLIDICGPLAAAHAAGVIHRDLKPSNVFLVQQPDGTRYLKLLDFGLAKKGLTIDGRTSQTSATSIAGTPDYMAPEQCRGLDVSAHTDLYALGVIAWQMLTGRLPFTGATPMDVMMAQVSGPIVAPSVAVPGLSPALDALVCKLMQKDPNARPASADELREELKVLGLQLRAGGGALPTRLWTGEMPAFDPGKYAAAQREAGSASLPESMKETREAPAEERPAPSYLWKGFAALGVLGLVAAGWLMLEGEKKQPAFAEHAPAVAAPEPLLVPPPPPQQPPPAVEAAAPEPSQEAGTPEPPGSMGKAPMLKHPVRDNTPTAAELTRRTVVLEKKLRAKAGSDVDPSAIQLLDKQRMRLSMSLTSVERRDVMKKLDSWERTFLKRP